MKGFPLSVSSAFVDVDSGIAYVVDNLGCSVWVMDRELKFVDRYGKRGRKEGEFFYPVSAKLKDDRLYVVDSFNHRIQIFDRGMNFVSAYGKAGVRLGEFTTPFDIYFSEDRIWVLERDNHRIQIFSSEWEPIWALGEVYKPPYNLVSDWLGRVDEYENHYAFLYPVRIIPGSNKEIYIVNSGNSKVLRLNKELQKISDFDRLSFPFSVSFLPDGYIAFASLWESHIDIYTEDFLFVNRIGLPDCKIEHITSGFCPGSLLVFDALRQKVFSVDVELSSGTAREVDVKPISCSAIYENYIESLSALRKKVESYEKELKEWVDRMCEVENEEEEIKKIPYEQANVDAGKIGYEIRRAVSDHRGIFLRFYDTCLRQKVTFGVEAILKELLKMVDLYARYTVEDMYIVGWYRMKIFSFILPHTLWETSKIIDFVDDKNIYKMLVSYFCDKTVFSAKKTNRVAVELFHKVRREMGCFKECTITPSDLVERLNLLFRNSSELARKGGGGIPLNERLELYAYIVKEWGGFLGDYNRLWWCSCGNESLSDRFSLLRALLSKRKLLCDMGSFYTRTSTRWDVDIYRDLLSAVLSLEFIAFADLFQNYVKSNGVDQESIDVVLGISSFHKNGSFFKGFEDDDIAFIDSLFKTIESTGNFSEGARKELDSLCNSIFPVFMENLSLWYRALRDDPSAFKEMIGRSESTSRIFNAWAKGLVSISVCPQDDTFDKIVRVGWMLGEDYKVYLNRAKTLPARIIESDETEKLFSLLYHFDYQTAAQLWDEIWEKGLNLESTGKFVNTFKERYALLRSYRSRGVPACMPDGGLVNFVNALDSILKRLQ